MALWLAAEAGYLSAGWFFDAVAPDSIAGLLTPLALAKPADLQSFEAPRSL
ncbi:hypothetical protein [Caballeronia sp. GAWG1-1]|uniref:hypothetical protein n=1 Tax=Caballeronia sp. GAWG1-1 TaxID=2921742 RepID=UPI00202925E8|nr:hypothetical protein [Caballeronia sp. GAWG1-1]